MATQQIPPLPSISLSTLDTLEPPVTRIKTDDDVETWRTTSGYQNLLLFIHHLSDSVVGHDLPTDEGVEDSSIASILKLLGTLDTWIDEIPPQATPQRFGNLAFRTWGKRLEDEGESILKNMLPASHYVLIPFLLPYLLTSFGSFTRLDYGTGHEASFALFLLSLALARFFPVGGDGYIERSIVLRVFTRYLRLCFRLQDVYRLEPAGSHGVWGLDDHQFLSYVFGSAQLRDQTEVAPTVVLQKKLPETNLYFVQINRVHELKSGPFFEHSSQLHAIATSVAKWSKVHSGLVKMYQAEVLGKRVVVQHLPLGGLIAWDPQSASTGPRKTQSAPSPATTRQVPQAGLPPTMVTGVHWPSTGHTSNAPTAAPWTTTTSTPTPAPWNNQYVATAVPPREDVPTSTSAPWARTGGS